MDPLSILIALTIAVLFLVPALFSATLGRLLVATLFIGGALFNALFTVPNAPDALEALVSTAFIPLYKDAVQVIVAWNAGLFVLLVVAFELTAGLLVMWRGPLVRWALLATGAWGISMLPVIPPEQALVGAALTGAPALASLLLVWRGYPHDVFTIVRSVATQGHPVPVQQDG